MRLELIGKSVNAPRFLETLEGKGWFVSYTLLLAEKHFEMPDAKKIYIVVVLIGSYLWDVQTIRFEEVIYEKDRTRRRKIALPPKPVLDQALSELNAASESAKELPAHIIERLEEVKLESAQKVEGKEA
ncbi:MAG: hypothetical protein APU95_05215 [Hadesarchaea archaeon YNP_N21]|jgi:hypothetical protein|nr:MAG: hypothetical protein APU95_05215 [Hadesarchaea archaeon YNP_N21]